MKKTLSLFVLLFTMYSMISYAQSVTVHAGQMPFSLCGMKLSCISGGKPIEKTYSNIQSGIGRISAEELKDAKCAKESAVSIHTCQDDDWATCPSFKYNESDTTDYHFTATGPYCNSR